MNDTHARHLPRLRLMLNGRLAPAELGDAMAQIRSCPECEQIFAKHALAEKALVGDRGELSAFAEDRIADRLFRGQPPEPRRWKGVVPLLAASAATAGILLVVGPSLRELQKEEVFDTRSAGERFDATTSIRVLRLRAQPADAKAWDIQDVSAGGKVRKGDKLRVLYESHDKYRFLSLGVFAADGRVLISVPSQPIRSDAPDRTAVRALEVSAAWPEAAILVARFSLEQGLQQPTLEEKAVDREREAIRIIHLSANGAH